ncbi:hypothetical protein Axi01nite_86080 [Actinoplanes xinjiangensis]|nr:hypothetical protein Axi01nite_86080 [Actinoplanes xinjiangensis]
MTTTSPASTTGLIEPEITTDDDHPNRGGTVPPASSTPATASIIGIVVRLTPVRSAAADRF